MTTKDSQRSAGYLLVEILVSLFVITMLVTIAALILNVSNNSRSRAENYSAANSLAFAKLQEYELYEFTDIPVGAPVNDFEIEDFSTDILNDPGNRFNDATGKVYSTAISGSLKKLWVNVEYVFGDSSFDIEYATYIQIDGVGR